VRAATAVSFVRNVTDADFEGLVVAFVESDLHLVKSVLSPAQLKLTFQSVIYNTVYTTLKSRPRISLSFFGTEQLPALV